MPRITLGSRHPRAGMEQEQAGALEAWSVDICQPCWQHAVRHNPRLRRSTVHHAPYQAQSPAVGCWLCQATLGSADNSVAVVREPLGVPVMAASAHPR